MSRTGALVLVFSAGCFFTFIIGVLAAIWTFPSSSRTTQTVPLLRSSYVLGSPLDFYKAAGKLPSVKSYVDSSDGRSVIIDNFLAKNHSPMIGTGKSFVFIADRYGIDWRLLPAIAFQESSLGKKMPKNSYNAWGWAVYTGQNKGVAFSSWDHAIETVAKGIKEKYISQGLTTPEAIMSRYTPSSDGSWAFAVQVAIDEMTQ